VRDPAVFFSALASHGIEHPEVRSEAPADVEGWLTKDANGCGGWHIRHAAASIDEASSSARSSHYYQRSMQGVPMSATFIANGKDAMVLGINELIVRPIGERPHVYCGCVGPVEVPAGLAQRIGDAVRVLVIEFDLRGWCSLDFVRDGDSFGVLEVNPRPPASMALYAQRGLIDAQLRACLHAELPPPSAFATSQVAGSEIVYARRPMTIGAAGALHLQQWPMAHDLPAEGESFSAGDPLCSLSASGDSAGQVKALLAARCDALLDILETSP
jgi:predicted ATP-grasp superfamily ATP-dependent carboligase